LAAGLAGVAASRYQPHTYLKGDSAFYTITARALLEDRTLEMSRHHPMSWYKGELRHYGEMDQAWSDLSLGSNETSYYPKHPYVLPIVALPFFAAFGQPGLLVFNVLAMAALLACAFALARTWVGPGPALLATLLPLLCGLVDRNVYTFSNDVFYSMLVTLGLVLALARRFVLAGVVIGLALWSKVTNVFFVPLLLLLAWQEARAHTEPFPWRRTVLRACVGLALPGLLMAIANTVMFGGPFITSYHRIITIHGGKVLVESASDAFHAEFWAGLQNVLFDAGEGIWPQAPVLFVAALAGIVGVWRIGLPALALPLMLGVLLAFHARYDFIWARFFLPLVGLAPLSLAAPFASRPRVPVGDLREDWRPEVSTTTVRVAGAIGLLCVVVVSIAMVRAGSVGREFRLSDRLSEARVQLADTPCDYLNPNTMKWECSRLDSEGWRGWGLSLNLDRPQCDFEVGDDDGQLASPDLAPRLWLHPSPGSMLRRAVWNSLGPLESGVLQFGYAKSSHGTDATLKVALDGRDVVLPSPERAGKLREVDLTPYLSADGPNRLEISVQARDHDYRQLCVDAQLQRPGGGR